MFEEKLAINCLIKKVITCVIATFEKPITFSIPSYNLLPKYVKTI